MDKSQLIVDNAHSVFNRFFQEHHELRKQILIHYFKLPIDLDKSSPLVKQFTSAFIPIMQHIPDRGKVSNEKDKSLDFNLLSFMMENFSNKVKSSFDSKPLPMAVMQIIGNIPLSVPLELVPNAFEVVKKILDHTSGKQKQVLQNVIFETLSNSSDYNRKQKCVDFYLKVK